MMFPRNPARDQPISGFAPTGLASYGSGGTTTASSVRGSITVSKLDIGYFSATYENNSQLQSFNGTGSASLQENAFLWIGGSAANNAYWTQNVIAINETSSTQFVIQLIDNVWNFSTASNSMEQSGITGSGSIMCVILNGGQTCPYIAVDSNLFTVNSPFTVNLTMSIVPGAGGGNGQF
jgi:hypothetical protein